MDWTSLKLGYHVQPTHYTFDLMGPFVFINIMIAKFSDQISAPSNPILTLSSLACSHVMFLYLV